MYIFEKYLAIPASNDEKYNWNNSAGQRLTSKHNMNNVLLRRIIYNYLSISP